MARERENERTRGERERKAEDCREGGRGKVM
jgi:hypothetical protein